MFLFSFMELICRDMEAVADSERARISASFFKTGVGEYGEGDVFLGIRNGKLREIVKVHWRRVGISDVGMLLDSKFHEKRLVGVLILVEKFLRADEKNRRMVYDFYLGNLRGVNNWDLVDLSAWKIVGTWLLDKDDRDVLSKLAKSENLWERRIAIVSTFAFIRKGEFGDTLRVSKMLLGDEEDLIRKAVGWMLREVGKQDGKVLRKFLRVNYGELSRVTLRYAIERFGKDERLEWLRGCE